MSKNETYFSERNYVNYSNFFPIKLHQCGDVMKPTGSCDCSAQQGEAFADVSVCAAHNGYRGTDGGQDGHDELNDVLNRFLFHNFTCCF